MSRRLLIRVVAFLLLGAIVLGIVVVASNTGRSRYGVFSVERFETIQIGATQAEVEALTGKPDFTGPEQPAGQEWVYKSSALFPTHLHGLIIKGDVVVRKYVKAT